MATVIGAAPVALPYVAGPPLTDAISFSFYGYVVWAAAIASWMALCQYVVLRAHFGHHSITAPIWIPATVIALVVAVLAIGIWQATVIPALVRSNALQALMQLGFPGVEVIIGLYAIPIALSLGLSQGVVLSNLYLRNLVRPWLFANLAAALIVAIVQGIQNLEMDNLLDGRYILDEARLATANVVFLGGSLLSVVLYGAVTGLTLFVLARPQNGVDTSPATQSGSPVSA
ncbi:MAG TPA: hypothetical protein VF383_12510 [Candidatus Dormibacteraeota bacterium]